MDDVDRSELRELGYWLVGMAIGFACGYQTGGETTTKRLRTEAIKAGAARWATDPKTGEARFEWATKVSEGKRP